MILDLAKPCSHDAYKLLADIRALIFIVASPIPCLLCLPLVASSLGEFDYIIYRILCQLSPFPCGGYCRFAYAIYFVEMADLL